MRVQHSLAYEQEMEERALSPNLEGYQAMITDSRKCCLVNYNFMTRIGEKAHSVLPEQIEHKRFSVLMRDCKSR